MKNIISLASTCKSISALIIDVRNKCPIHLRASVDSKNEDSTQNGIMDDLSEALQNSNLTSLELSLRDNSFNVNSLKRFSDALAKMKKLENLNLCLTQMSLKWKDLYYLATFLPNKSKMKRLRLNLGNKVQHLGIHSFDYLCGEIGKMKKLETLHLD